MPQDARGRHAEAQIASRVFILALVQFQDLKDDAMTAGQKGENVPDPSAQLLDFDGVLTGDPVFRPDLPGLGMADGSSPVLAGDVSTDRVHPGREMLAPV
jgi:hypothetical protein